METAYRSSDSSDKMEPSAEYFWIEAGCSHRQTFNSSCRVEYPGRGDQTGQRWIHEHIPNTTV